MNVQDLHPQFAEDIRARYRALDVREEELKREIAVAEQRLAGVRELKKQIALQIFDPAQTIVPDGPRGGQ